MNRIDQDAALWRALEAARRARLDLADYAAGPFNAEISQALDAALVLEELIQSAIRIRFGIRP